MTKTKRAKFIQIHTLHSYQGGVLLNRDDLGQAKRIPVGGTSRIRISSQCLKRRWRTDRGEHSLLELGETSVRSRHTFQKLIIDPIVANKLAPESLVRETVEALAVIVLGESLKAKKEKEREASEEGEKKKAKAATRGKKGKAAAATAEGAEGAEGPEGADVVPSSEEPEDFANFQTNQIVVMGPAEIAYLKQVTEDICRTAKGGVKPKTLLEEKRGDLKKNLLALARGAGLDASLMGRMTTSDMLATMDSVISVAHAWTVHAEEAESDYFSSVDDLQETKGTGHVNTTELTSGLFYGYVSVDIDGLLANLTGSKALKDVGPKEVELARDVVSRLIHLIAMTSPGAKKGATAPYSHAHAVIIESGRAAPNSMGSAFETAVSAKPNLLSNTYSAIARHINEHKSMYGDQGQSRVLSAMYATEEIKAAIGTPIPLDQAATWASDQIVTAETPRG